MPETVVVTDLDVVFEGGVTEGLTLFPSDRWAVVEPSGDIVVTFAPHPHRPGLQVTGSMTFKGQHIRWFAARDRVHTVRAKDESAA